VAGGRTWGGIGEEYSEKLPAISGNSVISSTIVSVVFYMFEKRVFAIAFKHYINLKLLLFSRCLKLSTKGERKKKS